MIPMFPLTYYINAMFLNFVCSSIVTLLVLSIKRDSRVVKLFAIFTGEIAIWSFFYWISLVVSDARAAELLFRACMVPVTLMPASFFHFITELSRVRVSRKTHYANYSLAAFFLLTVYTRLFAVATMKPVFVFPYWPEPGPIFPFHVAHFVGVVIVTHVLMLKVIRRADSQAFKTQIAIVFWGTLVAFGSGITNYLTWYRIYPPIPSPIISFYTVAILYAVFRHQLMDIRVIVRRSLIYSILIASITAVYLVMVLVMERWFQGFFGYRSLVATLIVAFFVAIFFDPLRSRIQGFVDHILFKATPVELAEQREQLLAEVRRGEQMKAVGTLAAGLAHEIKNPLASIKTFTEHLAQHHDDPVFREKFQKIVGGEVERINAIVQQLLEFAKPVPPKLIPVNVSQLLDETLEFLSNECVQRKVELRRHYTASGLVLADPQQLKQVFLNLLLNSLQAVNGHGELDVSTVISGNELEVTVADNGAGIDPKNLPHIFEPFFSTKPAGTGLGLAVVQGIVKEHQGRIVVESRLGCGTRVSIQLPVTT